MTQSLAVWIGRANPPHKGHTESFEEALESNDRLAILVGSANRSRSWRGPFTAFERETFIRQALGQKAERVDFIGIDDRLYDDAYWARSVRAAVQACNNKHKFERIVLTGFPKDRTSDYLNWFPEWESVPSILKLNNQGQILNATDFRRAIFLNDGDMDEFGIKEANAVRKWIKNHPDTFARLQEEGRTVEADIAKRKRAEKDYPYGICVPCVDGIIFKGDSVLMIKRGRAPGKGLWALPGGHIDKGEPSINAMCREVMEETGLIVSKSDITGMHIFDHPLRSDRGWVRSESYAIEWNPSMGMPKASQDKGEVLEWAWRPISQVRGETSFEDHHEIISHFAKRRQSIAIAA